MITAEEAKRISEKNGGTNYLLEMIDASIRQTAERGQRHVNLILNEKPEMHDLIRAHARMKALGYTTRSCAHDLYFQFEIWW
jgi:hypothetical protein